MRLQNLIFSNELNNNGYTAMNNYILRNGQNGEFATGQ